MRLPRPRLRRRKETPDEASDTVALDSLQKPGEQQAGQKDAPGATPDQAARPAGSPPPPADPHERIDGLRAWLADAERKLSLRTYAIGAATVLALAAAIVAIFLLMELRDESATTDEVQALRQQLGVVQQEAVAATEEQVTEISDRLQTLEQRVSRLADEQPTFQRELRVLEDDVDDLREQVLDLEDAVQQQGN